MRLIHGDPTKNNYSNNRERCLTKPHTRFVWYCAPYGVLSDALNEASASEMISYGVVEIYSVRVYFISARRTSGLRRHSLRHSDPDLQHSLQYRLRSQRSGIFGRRVHRHRPAGELCMPSGVGDALKCTTFGTVYGTVVDNNYQHHQRV